MKPINQQKQSKQVQKSFSLSYIEQKSQNNQLNLENNLTNQRMSTPQINNRFPSSEFSINMPNFSQIKTSKSLKPNYLSNDLNLNNSTNYSSTPQSVIIWQLLPQNEQVQKSFLFASNFDQQPQQAPFISQIFQKNLSSFIKKQFNKNVNILEFIDAKYSSGYFTFYFPSIIKQRRNIQTIDTLYADHNRLVLSPGFVRKNQKVVQQHHKARQRFLSQLKNYDWELDILKLNSIRILVENVPAKTSYKQLNFIDIKNCLNKCKKLQKFYAQQNKIQGSKKWSDLYIQLDNLVKNYKDSPQINEKLYDAIKMLVINIGEEN